MKTNFFLISSESFWFRFLMTTMVLIAFFQMVSAQTEFITTWQTTAANESITIPTNGVGYSYDVDWGDGNSTTGHTGNATHTYVTAGSYSVEITGTFPGIYFNNGGDKDKILSIEQWGTGQWTKLYNAFYGCSNVVGNATDTPDLSLSFSLSGMFHNATSFNQDIGNWNVNNITNFSYMFDGATVFNQDLDSWNTSSATLMHGMFFGASAFNEALNSWDVSGVSQMQDMFRSATSFNQPLNSWDVSFVSNMTNMFNGATSFNQNVDAWDVTAVTALGDMFRSATSFNQPLGSWDVSSIPHFARMFRGATSFDQDLSGWDVSSSGSFQDFLRDVTLSTANYDALFIAWDAQTLQTNVNFHGGNSLYCAGAAARANMIASDNWSFTDGGLDPAGCVSPDAFITTWQTTTGNESITIPTFGSGYNYDVDWGDGNTTTGHTGDATHSYVTAGTYQVLISGTFPRIYFNNGGDKDKIMSIDQWGTQVWTSMARAFRGCSNLVELATDAPDLSLVTDMSFMFADASSLNQDVGNWDVSNVVNMKSLFDDAAIFNQDISSWDVSSVTTMQYMFRDAALFNQNIGNWNVSGLLNMIGIFEDAAIFNQDISGWDVSSVNNMSSAFRKAITFNVDISSWDVSSVTLMEFMFSQASSFNQDIGNWDVSLVTSMRAMFQLSSFDHDLSTWDISNVGNMLGMFNGVTLSTTNYDALLIGWDAQTLQSNVTFDGGNSLYCAGATARANMIASDNWTITDGGLDPVGCGPSPDDFITTWQTTTTNESITIPTTGGGYSYDVDWGDGNTTTGHTGDATHTYVNAGTYQVSISGTFPRIYFNGGGDKDKIISIDQWGTGQWTSMTRAFRGCTNLAGQANDAPDLTLGPDLDYTFDGATSFNQDISNWDVSSVTRMTSLFDGAASFNQNIGSWNVSNVVFMSSTFSGASSFNQDIGLWDVSSVINMNSMFLDAIVFNQNIASWDVSSVTMITFMFTNADAFDQPIGNWNMSSVVDLYGMFLGADVFNQDIGGWDVSNVTSFSSVFDSAPLFNQDLSSWDVSAATSMGSMFGFATAFDQDISSWNVSLVTDMEFMFSEATSFNQDISGWNVSQVTTMDDMFSGAISFDQNLGAWDVSNVTLMNNMFFGVTMSTINYDALLNGWDSQTLQPNVNFHGGNSLYCTGATARANMITSDNWTITDGGLDPAGCGPSTDDFITTWQTTTVNESITIPTTGSGYNYDVDWGDGNTTTGHTGDVTHSYIAAGTYQISISGTFPRIYFNNGGDKDKIISIDQWGTGQWTNMTGSFRGCLNLAGQASDAPDLSLVTELDNMFQNAQNFNQDIGDWDVSNVQSMVQMFQGASIFNVDISTWDVSNVTTMNQMFDGASSFNQPLNSWDVSSVANMSFMFLEASSFNQSLNNWDVSAVTNMRQMFSQATSFNQLLDTWDVSSVTNMRYMFRLSSLYDQPLNSWDVSSVINMESMFDGASAFDQDLSSWNISQVMTMTNMLAGVTLSTANYDALLIGWDALTLQPNIFFHGGNSLYCTGATARANMIASDNWTITDGGLDPAGCGPSPDDFITTWQTTTANESITIPTTGSGYNYDVDWGDGNTTTGHTGDATHMYATAGNYSVAITGTFPRIFFNDTGDKAKIVSIDHWGTQIWASMNNAFHGCSNLAGQADDAPDLSSVTDLSNMFNGASSFNQDISSWDVSNITLMNEMFRQSTSFNQDIGNWNTSACTNMRLMFDGASSFNQDIGNWDLSNVGNITQMFKGASSFNQYIGAWDVSSVSNMERVFENASNFNQDIGSWDVGNVFTMFRMFRNASAFDQDLGSWNVFSVIDMSSMMTGVTLSLVNYDNLLIGWDALGLKPNVTFAAGNSKYCQGHTARANMIASDSWTITDGGIDMPTCLTCSRVVINTNDSGPGSFREAIDCANNEIGADTITFNIPGTGPHIIEFLTTVDILGDSTVIDATTQPTNSPMNGEVIMDMSNMTSLNNILLQVEGTHSEIYGLAFRNNFLSSTNTGIFYFLTAEQFVLGDSARGNWFIEDKWSSCVFVKENLDTFRIQSNIFQSDSLRISRGITISPGTNNGLIGGDSIWHQNQFYNCNQNALELRNACNDILIVGNHFEKNAIAIHNRGNLNSGFNKGNHYINNTFICNTNPIVHDPMANLDIAPPVIEYSKVNFVSGTCEPSAVVELYYTPDTCSNAAGCMNGIPIARDTADIIGQFHFSFPSNDLFTLGHKVSAIQTDTLVKGSSAFSLCATLDSNCVDFVYSCEDGIIGSIRSAIDCALPGDTIYFLSFLMGENLILDNSLLVDKDVSIFGLGNPGTSISANATGYTIQIDPTKEVFIKDLSLCVNSGATSIIENYGDLNLKNITITDKRTGQPLPLIVNHPSSTLTIEDLVEILKQ